MFFKKHHYLVGLNIDGPHQFMHDIYRIGNNGKGSFDYVIRGWDCLKKLDVGKVYVTTFDIALGSLLGQHNACIIAPTCGHSLVLEHNGDVYSCDHFVEPKY